MNIRSLLLEKTTPPIAEFDVPPVEFHEASGLKPATTISHLCDSVSLKISEEDRTISRHFTPKNNDTLKNELEPLIYLKKNTEAFIVYINQRINHKDENQEALAQYIDKEKKRLLDEMRKLKVKKVGEILKRKAKAYEECVSSATPNDYRNLKDKYYYIKRNVIVALYNAARDYYKSIWETHSTAIKSKKSDEAQNEEAKKFSAKILSFNHKFAGIASINPDTLELSSIEEAYANTKNLKLVHEKNELSFEFMVDELVKRCAHKDESMIYTHGAAFRAVQSRLNTFNESSYYDPLTDTTRTGSFFVPLNASGEASKLSILRAVPLGTVASDLIGAASSKIWETHEFAFNINTKSSIKLIKDAKKLFPNQLAIVRAHLEALKESTQAEVNTDEKELGYDGANTNIIAYADLLRQKNSVIERVDRIKKSIHQQIDELTPIKEAAQLFKKLALQLEIEDSVTEELIAQAFDKEVLKNIETHQSALEALLPKLDQEQKKLDELIQEAWKKDSLIDDHDAYLHTESIDTMNKRLQALSEEVKSICAGIKKTRDAQHHSDILIKTFTAIKNMRAEINQFTKRFLNTGLNQPETPFDKTDILAPANRFYQEAQSDYMRLLAKIAELNKLCYETNQYYQANASETAAQVLTQQIDTAKTNTQAMMEETQQSLIQSKIDTNTLLLCHIIMNALLNFTYWEHASRKIDSTYLMHADIDTYKVPKRISQLVFIAKRNEFSNWVHDPKQARNLLNALQTAANSHSSNDKIEAFFAYLREPANLIGRENTEDLKQVITSMKKVCSEKPLVTITVVTRQELADIKRIPTYWEIHPVLKKTLIGLAIGFALLAIAAITVGIIAATFGAGAIAATFGGSAAAIGILTTLGAITVATPAITGFVIAKNQQKRLDILDYSTSNDKFRSSSFKTLTALPFTSHKSSSSTSTDVFETKSTAMIPIPTRKDFEYEFIIQLCDKIKFNNPSIKSKTISGWKLAADCNMLERHLTTVLKHQEGGHEVIMSALRDTIQKYPEYEYSSLLQSPLKTYIDELSKDVPAENQRMII